MVHIVEINVAALEVAELRNGSHGAHGVLRRSDSEAFGVTVGNEGTSRQMHRRMRVQLTFLRERRGGEELFPSQISKVDPTDEQEHQQHVCGWMSETSCVLFVLEGALVRLDGFRYLVAPVHFFPLRPALYPGAPRRVGAPVDRL